MIFKKIVQNFRMLEMYCVLVYFFFLLMIRKLEV